MRINDGLARNFDTNLKDMKVSGFQMKASPAAFRILSDSLYKNPHLACVRELVCNAWDSHVKKGNTSTPIEVHAPTGLEPYFEVNDFGVSMDHEFMHSRYITFFDSDKDHNDDAIGGYGLGSKAPFAYADQFTVRCRLDGIESIYQMLINKNSEYQIMDRGQSRTTEPDGVKITVPVADKDIESFRDAVVNVLTFFPVIPKCNVKLEQIKYSNSMEISPDVVVRYVESNTTHTIGRPEYLNRNFAVVMGFVKYTCDWNSLTRLASDCGGSADLLLYSHIHVPINYLDITPDREGIRFSDKTKQRLMDVVLGVKSKSEESIKTAYDAIKTPIEKDTWLRNISNNSMRKIANALYRKEIDEEFRFPEKVTLITATIPRYSKNVQSCKDVNDLFDISIIRDHREAIRNNGYPNEPIFYQMSSKRPYKHHFIGKPTPYYILIGDEDLINTWAKKVGLPTPKVVPKRVLDPNRVRVTKPKLPAQSVRGYEIQNKAVKSTYKTMTEYDTNFDSPILMPTYSDAWDLVKGFEANSVMYKLFKGDIKEAFVTVPEAHTRIRNIFKEGGAVEYKDKETTLANFVTKYGVDIEEAASYLAISEQAELIVELSHEVCFDKYHYSHKDKLPLEVIAFAADPKVAAKHPELSTFLRNIITLRNNVDAMLKFIEGPWWQKTFLESLNIPEKTVENEKASLKKSYDTLVSDRDKLKKTYGEWVQRAGFFITHIYNTSRISTKDDNINKSFTNYCLGI